MGGYSRKLFLSFWIYLVEIALRSHFPLQKQHSDFSTSLSIRLNTCRCVLFNKILWLGKILFSVSCVAFVEFSYITVNFGLENYSRYGFRLKIFHRIRSWCSIRWTAQRNIYFFKYWNQKYHFFISNNLGGYIEMHLILWSSRKPKGSLLVKHYRGINADLRPFSIFLISQKRVFLLPQ